MNCPYDAARSLVASNCDAFGLFRVSRDSPMAGSLFVFLRPQTSHRISSGRDCADTLGRAIIVCAFTASTYIRTVVALKDNE